MSHMSSPKVHRSSRLLILVLVLSLLLGTAAVAAPEPEQPDITAAAAIVMDYDTGQVLYEKDADAMRVPASMTKVMTAYLIFEELEAGNLTLDTLVPISAENAQNLRLPRTIPPRCPCPPGPRCRWTPCSS